MRFRAVLGCGCLGASAFLQSALLAQETPGKRLAGVVAVAMSEYRLGVAPDGTLKSSTEVDEARGFLADAKGVADRMAGGGTGTVRALLDSLTRAVGAARSTREVDALYDRFVIALGGDAALDLPSRHFDLVGGKALFALHCASCHGLAGRGDGPAAQTLLPRPAPLTGDSARDLAPGLMYRIVSVGVKGTAMAGWAGNLSTDQRWDVIAYVNSLRAAADTAGRSPGRRARDLSAVEARVSGYLDAAVVSARRGRSAEAVDRAFDAYAAFEPVESIVRARDAALVARLEAEFLDFRYAIRRGDASSADSARVRVRLDLQAALKVAASTGSRAETFAESLVIILREGFEAILIIGAIVAMLVRTGNAARVKEVWLGAALAVGASAVTAFALQTTLRALPATNEVIEAITLLVAVAVLFSVSYWILSNVESARWQAYVRERVDAATAGGRRAAMVGVAFLVVYREGAETTLFYQALLQQGAAAAPAVLGGFVVGSAALAAVYVLFHRFGVRMPLRQFFAVTGTLLYVMAMVFAGKGVRELQEGGILQTTPIGWLPRLDALGVYPSVETFAAQWLLLGVFVLAVWHTFITQRVRGSRRSPGVPGPSSGAATSTALQPPRTPARTSAPS